MIKWVKDKCAKFMQLREQYRATAALTERLRCDPETMCKTCDGSGDVRVRNIRSVTGYEMCGDCGGMGYKPEARLEVKE